MSKGLRPGSKFHRAMELVREIPSRSEEIAAEMEITTHAAGALLADLRKRGYIRSEPFGNVNPHEVIWHAVEEAA